MANLLAAIRRRQFDTLVYLAPSNRTIDQVERDRWFFSLAGIKHFIGMEGLPHLPAKTPDRFLHSTASEADFLLKRFSELGIPVVNAQKRFMRLGLRPAEPHRLRTS